MTQNMMGRCQGMQKEKARQERVSKSMIVLLSATTDLRQQATLTSPSLPLA